MSDVYVEDGKDQPYLVKELESARYEFPMAEIFQKYQVENKSSFDIVSDMDDSWDEGDIHVAAEYWARDEDNFYEVKEAVDDDVDEDLWHEKLDSENETNLEAVEQELRYIVGHEESPFSEESVITGSNYVSLPITEGEPDALLRAKETDSGMSLSYAILSKSEASVVIEESESWGEEVRTVLNMAFNDIMANVDFR